MERNWNKDWRKSIIVLSGGFDPVHKGHLRMFREASWLGHQVVVGLNSDDWLTRKKGKPFMEFEERKEILEGFRYINQVLPFDDIVPPPISVNELATPGFPISTSAAEVSSPKIIFLDDPESACITKSPEPETCNVAIKVPSVL